MPIPQNCSPRTATCCDALTTPCVEWGGYTKNGYGVKWFQGMDRYVHRLEWEKHHGPIQGGMFVCHHCDNKLCYNIDHLFLGTAADNNADMTAKGRDRKARGAENGRSKLTPEQVDEIRRRCTRGETQASIAEAFDVSPSWISRVVRREFWAWR